jgi:hypothetical protein
MPDFIFATVQCEVKDCTTLPRKGGGGEERGGVAKTGGVCQHFAFLHSVPLLICLAEISMALYSSVSKRRPALWNRNYFFSVQVSVPVPTFEKLWFRFRLVLLKSYGSGLSSISRPLKANFSKIIKTFFYLFT